MPCVYDNCFARQSCPNPPVQLISSSLYSFICWTNFLTKHDNASDLCHTSMISPIFNAHCHATQCTSMQNTPTAWKTVIRMYMIGELQHELGEQPDEQEDKPSRKWMLPNEFENVFSKSWQLISCFFVHSIFFWLRLLLGASRSLCSQGLLVEAGPSEPLAGTSSAVGAFNWWTPRNSDSERKSGLLWCQSASCVFNHVLINKTEKLVLWCAGESC